MKIIVENEKIKIIRTKEELAKEVKNLKSLKFESYITENFIGLGITMPVMRLRDYNYKIKEGNYEFIDDINEYFWFDNKFNLAIFRALKLEYEIPILFNIREFFDFLRAFRIALKIKNFKKYRINMKELLREEGFILEKPSSFFKEILLEAENE